MMSFRDDKQSVGFSIGAPFSLKISYTLSSGKSGYSHQGYNHTTILRISVALLLGLKQNWQTIVWLKLSFSISEIRMHTTDSQKLYSCTQAAKMCLTVYFITLYDSSQFCSPTSHCSLSLHSLYPTNNIHNTYINAKYV